MTRSNRAEAYLMYASTSHLQVMTGPLDGTRGRAGAITVSVATNGWIYFENRSTGRRSINYTIVGRL